MPLAPGSRFGPYSIETPLGAGGMGEVYRARDTVLNRAVAIKIVPDLFAGDPERMGRFSREAQTLAALNHPNIAHVYGLEGSGLVMELVDGQDLAERLTQGPLPLDDALPIAKQIVEALEAAHNRGIVHRDLKPANIKVRADGVVKVLDFGLAKALDPASDPASSDSNSPTVLGPTLRSGLSQQGIILGTAAYMAPEQAKGKAVDKRADVWAFGCVLFEMLSGHRVFDDEDVSLTLSRVLQSEPAWDQLPPATPPRVRRVLEWCLKKDLKERVADIHDVRLALEGAFETAAPSSTDRPSSPGWRRAGALAAAACLAAAAVTGAIVWLVMRPAAPR